MTPQELIASVRVVSALAVLAFAGVLDYRGRRVPDRAWVPFVLPAAFFVLWDLNEGAWLQLLLTTWIVVASWVMYAARVWGGADAKGVTIAAAFVHILPALVIGFLLVYGAGYVYAWRNAVKGRVTPRMFLGPVTATGDLLPVRLPFLTFLAASYFTVVVFGAWG